MLIWPKLFRRIGSTLRAFLRHYWQNLLRIRGRLRINEETFHLVMAGIVGIVGGLINLILYVVVQWITAFSLSHSGDVVQVAYLLSPWERVLIPSVGGLAAGLTLFWGLRLVRHQGSNNFLEVVVAGDGRLRMRSALVKAVSSLMSIGTGASIGREGSITQLTATLASKGGQLANWQPYRLRLLVACGAASGLAAAYNAPIAGAVFAAQIVLGNFSMNLFGPLVFASVVATMVSRTFFGMHPWYEAPALDFPPVTQLPWFVVLGVLCGGLGAVFLKMLRFSEEMFEQLGWPIYFRFVLSGVLVGGLAIFFPEVWGNGYSVTNKILLGQFVHEPFPVWFLIGVFLAKLLATVITVGSGVVGGVFTPTLFLGAAFGSLAGALLHWFDFARTVPLTAFALVGMGSVLSATIHSPLLALIMIFEISLNYSLMAPLMLACAVATLVSRGLHLESIYTEPLRRKGLQLEKENQQMGAATFMSVGELMREPVDPLPEITPFREIADRFLTSPHNFFPVIDAQRRLVGLVALHDMKEYLNAGNELNGVIAFDIMRPPPACVTPNQKLLDVLPILLASELKNIPVVNNPAEFRLVGAIPRAEALGLLSEAIATRTGGGASG